MKNYKNNSGFTLIELMVTVAIVGIFASIALPSFARLIENNRVTTATNELVSGLTLTRSEALKRSADVTMCASTDQTSCSGSNDFSTGWAVFQDCDGDGDITAGNVDCNGDSAATELIKVFDGNDSIYMENSRPAVTYLFSGRVDVSTFEIGTSDAAADQRKTVVLNRVGRLRVNTVTPTE